MNNKQQFDFLYDVIQKLVPSNMMVSAINTLTNTIPSKAIDDGFDSFARSYTKEDKLTLEISILTKDKIIHDLTFTPEKYAVIYMKLSQATWVHLTTYNPTDAAPSNYYDIDIPYRAELRITNGIINLQYDVEGDRRVVNSLVSYSQKLLLALHES